MASSLITTRRVIFTPNTDIKDELARTSISITCYDRNGEIVKRVTSSDEGNVEDEEPTDTGGGDSTGGSDSTGGGDNSGGSGSDVSGGGGSDNPDFE